MRKAAGVAGAVLIVMILALTIEVRNIDMFRDIATHVSQTLGVNEMLGRMLAIATFLLMIVSAVACLSYAGGGDTSAAPDTDE